MEVLNWAIADYQHAILDAMKPDYEWYTLEMLKKIDKITIAQIRDLVDSRRNQNENDIWREPPLNTPEEVVDTICHDIRQKIEWSPSKYLNQLAVYRVPFQPQELLGGWMLENYSFSKYEGNVYFSSATAGDRSAGSSRTFYIPRRIIKGHTYEEFLDAYFNEIASPRAFGLGKEALIHDHALKEFLGFSESSP